MWHVSTTLVGTIKHGTERAPLYSSGEELGPTLLEHNRRLLTLLAEDLQQRGEADNSRYLVSTVVQHLL